MLLSNLVSEMVIVTAPPLPLAKMAPPYKVDVPPPDMQEVSGVSGGFYLAQNVQKFTHIKAYCCVADERAGMNLNFGA